MLNYEIRILKNNYIDSVNKIAFTHIQIVLAKMQWNCLEK